MYLYGYEYPLGAWLLQIGLFNVKQGAIQRDKTKKA